MFLPTGYNARLAIDPAADGFSGSIAITGVIDQPSSVIWLHGRDLAVQRATASHDTSEITLTVTPRGDDMLELTAGSPLVAGTWTVMIDYEGKLDLINTTGAFKQVVQGAPYVYTQLEALYARRVFPCLDEPDNKVPWRLTLDVPSKLVAVSNAPVISDKPLGDGTKRVEFAETKPLPSYLVAFGVGPFDIVDAGKTKYGTPVRVITLANRASDATWAVKTTPRLTELVEDFFGVPYPYQKLDMITIPLTAGFTAMENAGLITYSETAMLMDPKTASKERQLEWVRNATHEIAHQWFGNLVTMKFWDDIWLNEGFATWLEVKLTAKFEASWRHELSALDLRNNALTADALVTARQVRQPIRTTDDIFNVFDSITYDKGSSLLAMFEHHLGKDVFQRGVREYLRSREWGNATSADFVAALSKAAGRDVGPAFSSFLDQPGAPEIAATLVCDGAPRVELRQQRHVPPGSAAPAAGKPWIVPVCVAYDRDAARGEDCTLLEQTTGSIALTAKACPRWMMPNVDGRGYYRNSYTQPQLIALRDEAWPALSGAERRALYFDVKAQVVAGKLPLALALSFVPKLLASGDRFQITAAFELSASLDRVVPGEFRPRYEHWMRQMFGPGARKAGFVPSAKDTLDIEVTRHELLVAVAQIGRDPQLVQEAIRMASGNWRALPDSIRGLVLSVAANARADLFDRIAREVKSEPDRVRRGEMYKALGSVTDPVTLRKALTLLLDSKLDIREASAMLWAIDLDRPLEAAQQFFRSNEKAILARLPSEETAGSVTGLSRLFAMSCKPDRRAEIADYMTKTFGQIPGGARVVMQQIEAMDQCIAARANTESEVRGWLSGVKLPKP
ncbi:MAG: M1 family aminopeptidase [Kofleriaceae bacterium]